LFSAQVIMGRTRSARPDDIFGTHRVVMPDLICRAELTVRTCLSDHGVDESTSMLGRRLQ
jgi:hypothetical protein